MPPMMAGSPSLTVDLFPYDAGTEEGTEFSLSNAATSPQGAITSIKGTGKFSNEPIANLTLHSPVGNAGDHQCGDLHCG